eukprot:10126289-Alexandrium_andersonii.AAC.1
MPVYLPDATRSQLVQLGHILRQHRQQHPTRTLACVVRDVNLPTPCEGGAGAAAAGPRGDGEGQRQRERER